MKIKLNPKRGRIGVTLLACVLALLVIVIGTVVIIKLISFCQKHFPNDPAGDPEPNLTNVVAAEFMTIGIGSSFQLSVLQTNDLTGEKSPAPLPCDCDCLIEIT